MSFWDGAKWVDGPEPERRPRLRGDAPNGPLARWGDLFATGIMVVILAGLAIPLGAARGGEPSLRLSPESGAPGTSVQVSGTAFPARGRLQVTWDGVAAGLPAVRVNGSGAFKTTIVVPDAAAGSHVVAVVDGGSRRKRSASRSGTAIAGATFNLTAAASTPTPTSLPDPTQAPAATEPPASPPPIATPTPGTVASPTPAPNATPTSPPIAGPTTGPAATPTPAPTASSTPPPPPALSGFVQARGTRLTLNGELYRFKGFNIYNANSRDNCWYPLGYNNGALGDALAAVGPGQNAFRAWFYQDLATTNGVRDWAAFDHTIAVAKRHNVRIIATLADQWGSCDSGPKGVVFKGDAWYSADYRSVVAPGSTKPYRDWVAEIVARYRNEPTILAWQLMNEAEIRHDIDSSCTANGATLLRAWAADVSGLVKSIDANHLVSLGTLGGGQCGTQGSDYQLVHNLATIDLCEYHDYLPDAMPGDQWNGLAVRLGQCAALGKPLFVGETGQQDMSLATRASVFASKFATQFGAGVVGELVWALRIESQGGSSTTNYDVGPTDPLVSLFDLY